MPCPSKSIATIRRYMGRDFNVSSHSVIAIVHKRRNKWGCAFPRVNQVRSIERGQFRVGKGKVLNRRDGRFEIGLFREGK